MQITLFVSKARKKNMNHSGVFSCKRSSEKNVERGVRFSFNLSNAFIKRPNKASSVLSVKLELRVELN